MTPDSEVLAQLLSDSIESRETALYGGCYVDDSDLSDVVVDGHVDMRAVAEDMIAYFDGRLQVMSEEWLAEHPTLASRRDAPITIEITDPPPDTEWVRTVRIYPATEL